MSDKTKTAGESHNVDCKYCDRSESRVDCVEIKDDGIKLHLNLDGFDDLFVELTA